MGSSNSSEPKHNLRIPNQNHNYVDRLKSALAINKRKHSLLSTFGDFTHGFRVQRAGTYKTLDENAKVGYQTYSVCGRGSFGVVYAARNDYGQILAVKCKKMLPDPDLMEKSKLLFRDELEALYNLNHPNIVKLIGVEFDGRESVGLVMEYIIGETLDKVIRQYRSLNEQIIQSFAKQMTDALAYMHSQFVMHRDMKSSNVMVINGGILKLIDFGMAKHFDFTDSSVSDYDMSSSTIVGTVPYMAPELISFGKYNSKVDIWSIGVITYEMSNGDVFVRTPRSNFGVDTLSLSQAPGPINAPSLSPLANSFIQACLIKNHDFRPPATSLLMHPFIRNIQNPAYAGFNPYGFSQYLRQPRLFN